MNTDVPADMPADATTGTNPGPDAPPGSGWLAEALAEVARDPDSVTRAFALAARRVGRGPLRPGSDPSGVVHGTVDDAARAALVVALADAVGTGPECAARLVALYRQGDGAERRGVLRGLDALEDRGDLGGADAGAGNTTGPDAGATIEPGTGTNAEAGSGTSELVVAGLDLAADALRTNDPSLVAAAVGPFGSRHLDQHTWRHAVLKLVFQGVSLDAVSGLDARVDNELDRMARDFAAERRAAGRPVPADLDRLTTDRLTTTRHPNTQHPNTRLSSRKE